jgi:hypothetical protein
VRRLCYEPLLLEGPCEGLNAFQSRGLLVHAERPQPGQPMRQAGDGHLNGASQKPAMLWAFTGTDLSTPTAARPMSLCACTQG